MKFQSALPMILLFCLLARPASGEEPGWHMHIKPGAYSGVAFPGEKAEYRIKLKNTTSEDREVEMRLRSTSDVGEKWDKDWTLKIAAAQETIATPVLPTDEIGYWAIKIQVFEDGKPVPLEQEVSPGQRTVRDYFESGLMVVAKPPSYGKRDPENYFGLIFMEDFEATERLGVKNMMPYPDWGTFEPSPGVYRYNWLDGFFEQAQKHKLEVILKLNHWPMPHWAMWRAHGGYKGRKEYDTLPADAAMKHWGNYCKAMVERYKGKLVAIEINNEPDLSFWMGPQIPIEEGAELYVKLLKNGYEGIKAADPNVLVAGCGVSGWDSSTGYRFTKLVLEGGKDYLDIFTGHPYADIKYYARGGSTPPEESGMAQKLNEALDLLEKHGKKREMWIGELGWGLHFNEPLLGSLSLEYAGGIGQMLILGRSVPGVSKIFKHTGVTCNEGGHVYGLFRAYSPMYPTPSACAYATCARELHHVEPDGELEIAPAIRAFKFKHREKDRVVYALWTNDEKIRLRFRKPATTTVVNSFGRLIGKSRELLSVPLSEMPTYVRVSGSDVATLEKELNSADIDMEHPITIEKAYLSSNTELTIDLQNHGRTPLEATIRWFDQKEQRKIAPGVTRLTLNLSEPIALQKSLDSEVTVETESKTERVDATIHLQPLRYLSEMKVDGDLSEVRSLEEVHLDTREDVKPSDPGIPWDGPQDLSVRSWLGWNEKALYFAARVTDDIHHVPVWEGNFWDSDSVQVAIDAANDSGLGFERQNDREVGFVLGPKGAHAYMTFPDIHRQECELHIAREGNVTTYEVAIAWSTLRIKPPVAGRVMAINYTVNENDGKGRACWIGPASGIVEKKEPGLYPEFVLIR